MNSKVIKRYQDIAALNRETFQFMHQMGWDSKIQLIIQNKIILTLKVADEQQEGSEWTGFVQTMKIFIKKHLAITNDKFQDTVKTLKTQISIN